MIIPLLLFVHILCIPCGGTFDGGRSATRFLFVKRQIGIFVLQVTRDIHYLLAKTVRASQKKTHGTKNQVMRKATRKLLGARGYPNWSFECTSYPNRHMAALPALFPVGNKSFVETNRSMYAYAYVCTVDMRINRRNVVTPNAAIFRAMAFLRFMVCITWAMYSLEIGQWYHISVDAINRFFNVFTFFCWFVWRRVIYVHRVHTRYLYLTKLAKFKSWHNIGGPAKWNPVPLLSAFIPIG